MHAEKLNSYTKPKVPMATRLGAVRIAVRDAAQALRIWRDVVGLELLSEEDGLLRLGAGVQVLVELEPGASGPVMERTIGLYHVALHVPQRSDLAQFVVRAIEAGVRIAPTDHLISEAVYLWDLDGNGIEMTFETPSRGSFGSDVPGAYGTTRDGKPHSGREPIDLDDLLAELKPDTRRQAYLPARTRVGHVHVHVNSLDEAMGFYRDAIGFGGLQIMPDWGLGDVGLDYAPHAIAFNIWAGTNAELPQPDVAGLRFFTIVPPDASIVAEIAARVRDAGYAYEPIGGGFATRDPSGNLLHVIAG